MRPSLPARLLAWASTLATIAFLSVPVAGSAAPHAPKRWKLDRALRKWQQDDDHRGGKQRVIVRLRSGSRAAVLKAFRSGGFKVWREQALINALIMDVPRDQLDRLSDNDDIETVSIDALTVADTSVAPSSKTLQATLGVPAVMSSRGDGVGVAVIDSGIAPLNVFGNRLVAFYDFTSGTVRATTPSDAYGHGTHVAGLIAAAGTAGPGKYPGVAPGARLIGMKVLDANGQGYASTVIAAIEFAIAYRQQLGIDVINLSLGHPVFEAAATDPLVQAVESASRAGIVVVASAGNFGMNPLTGQVGYAGVTSPGSAPSAITVGALDTKGTATRRDDSVAPYSSRGPTWYDGLVKPDVVAPGQALTAVSTSSAKLWKEYTNARVSAWGDYSNKYLRLNGTSMAAAVVSGVVALMIDAHRDAITWTQKPLSPNLVKAILQYSAVPLLDRSAGSRPYDVLTQGAGAVNAQGAIDLAEAVDPSQPIGSFWMTAQPSPYFRFGYESAAWAQYVVWGSHIVWGNSLFVHERAWEPTVQWGDASPLHIVWGNVDALHLVWGNVAVWGQHIVWGNALVGSVSGSHIVWGNLIDAEHVVWGNLASEHVVWGNADPLGNNEAGVVEGADPEEAAAQ
jgi:serine protease AprX